MKSQSELYNGSLLEYLASVTKNSYLSNLFYATPFATISLAIASIPAEAYSLPQWEEATQYLLREKIVFSSAQEAISYLTSLGQSIQETPHDFLQHNLSFAPESLPQTKCRG